MQSLGGPFHSKTTGARTDVTEGCNRTNCVLVISSLK